MGTKQRIVDEADHRLALKRAAALMRAEPGTAEMQELEALTAEIEAYEARATPIGEPSAEGFAEHLAEASADPYGLLHYTDNVETAAVDAIVRFCGIALKGKDSQWVSVSDPAEVRRVVDGFCAKRLGLDARSAEAAVRAVGERMKAERTKHRVTFYYLLAEQSGSLARLVNGASGNRANTRQSVGAH